MRALLYIIYLPAADYGATLADYGATLADYGATLADYGAAINYFRPA